MQSDPEFQEMQAEHLDQLTIGGEAMINNVASAVSLLKESLFGDMELSQQEQLDIFDVLEDTINRHLELIDWSVQTRKEYIESRWDE